MVARGSGKQIGDVVGHVPERILVIGVPRSGTLDSGQWLLDMVAVLQRPVPPLTVVIVQVEFPVGSDELYRH